jgi:hypothetical protein
MKRKKLIPRLIVSPFVLCIILITYFIGAMSRFIKFVRYGGEMVTYAKKEVNLQDIYNLIQDKNETDEQKRSY